MIIITGKTRLLKRLIRAQTATLFEAARDEAKATVDALIQDGILTSCDQEEYDRHVHKIACHIVDFTEQEYNQAKEQGQVH